MLRFCMNAYRINFWSFTFYNFSADLLKNISVQRPQIQYMFCLDTGQNVLTNKYAACLLKHKLGCSVSLYLKVIQFMKSKRQQTDKLMFNSISSGKNIGLTIHGSFYYSDIVWEKRQYEPKDRLKLSSFMLSITKGRPPKSGPQCTFLVKKYISHKELLLWMDATNTRQEGKWKRRKEKRCGYRPEPAFLVPKLMVFPQDHITRHTPSERAGAKMSTGKTNDTDTHIFPTQCGFAVFTVNICNRM